MPSQIQPGIQFKALSNGESQPPRNMSDGQDGHQPHVGVFGQEEHGKAHARVLDHVAGDDLGLALDHVERMAVGFGQAGDEVHDEDRQQRQPVPGQEAQPMSAAMPLPCPITMSVRFMLADTMSTTRKQKPMAIS
jgi:hypothetical protein